MYILIEGHQYEAAKVKDVLQGIDVLENVEGMVSINYVGYFYNNCVNDCVLILPKVLLKGEGREEKVFGAYQPEDIINLDKNTLLNVEEKKFIYEFAVWIYRTIIVFKKNNSDSDIIYQKNIMQVGKGRRRPTNTFLDTLLELIRFNKENQDLFFFTLRNLHSGYNKINWTRTISKTTAIMQGNSPIYLNPINKKRQINFDEELLVIFFSILNYIGDTYGFEKNINCNIELIKGSRFKMYLEGLGKSRLLKIKYKYYSDKALELWELCDAFFDQTKQVRVNTDRKEYLLVKNFNIVFEAIIDELISDKTLPDGMDKKQEDGKIVDHLFRDRSLIENKSKYTYYIGDSKYYKIGHELSSESIYKQYTYARNVIQWNLDFFNNNITPPSGIKLRDDELTEGYNIIPNFFISAKIDRDENSITSFDYTDDWINRTNRKKNKHKQVHFKNRLFDRDTLLLFHYDVNFLFVVSLYARDNTLQKSAWKEKVREVFRKEIQDWLQEDFKFYAMTPHPDLDVNAYIKEHFRDLLGKIYTPYADKNILSLALENGYEDNEKLLMELRNHFYVAECKLGENPQQHIERAINATKTLPTKFSLDDGILMIPLAKYKDKIKEILRLKKVAVGIEQKLGYMKIVENIKSIKYVLFHTISGNDKNMFAIEGDCVIKLESNIPKSDVYIFPQEKKKDEEETEEEKLYIIFDISNEIDTSNINLRRKPKSKMIDDAQYAMLKNLYNKQI